MNLVSEFYARGNICQLFLRHDFFLRHLFETTCCLLMFVVIQHTNTFYVYFVSVTVQTMNICHRILTHSNCVWSLLPTLSLTDWSCVGSGLQTDVSDFSWQRERHKGHKSGNKWKRVHFPSCSLLWIGNAAVWASFVGFFPSGMQADQFCQNNMAAHRYI